MLRGRGTCIRVVRLTRMVSGAGGVLALVLGTGGCAANRFPVSVPEVQASREQVLLHRAQEYFIKAREYDYRGLPQMAEAFYKLAFEADPSSLLLRELLVTRYIQSGKHTEALLVLRERRTAQSPLTEREKMLLSGIYVELGQYERAARVLEEIEADGPEKHNALALLYESSGDLERALYHYQRFFSDRPDNSEVGQRIAALYFRLERFEELEEFLVALGERLGTDAALLNMLGMVRLARNDTAEALVFYRMALIEDSTNDEARRSIAQIHIQNSDYAAAIEHYEHLYRSGAWGALYGRTLALLYYYDGKYEQAGFLLKELLTADVTDYELHYYLGLVKLAQGDGDVARLQLEKALELNPSFEDAWRQLCYEALQAQDTARGLECARRFTQTLAQSPIAWRFLASMYSSRKEYRSASDALHTALSLDSTDWRAWFERGSAWERLGYRDSAAQAFRIVLANRPRDALAANYLGYMWADADTMLDSAKALIELALEEEPENGAYLDSYAWVFYRMGDYEKAYVFIVEALKFLDDEPVVLEHLGDIQLKRGELREALEAYVRALALEPDNQEDLRRKIEKLNELIAEG